MKVYVVGAGAVGTWFGAHLRAIGCEVIFAPRALEDVGPVDVELAVVAVKAFDTPGAVATLQRSLRRRSETAILCLQNGVGNEEQYAEVFGRDRIIAGALTVPVERNAQGQSLAASCGGLGLAPLGWQAHNWLIALLGRTGIPIKVCSDARALKWSKLALNLLANASCAILDMTPAVLVRHPELFALEMKSLRELKALFAKMRISPIDLPRYPIRALFFAASLSDWLSYPLLAARMAGARGSKLPSLLGDLRCGRGATEVGSLNGAIDREAQRQGLQAPVNAALTQMLEAITATPALWERYRGHPDAFLEEIFPLRSL